MIQHWKSRFEAIAVVLVGVLLLGAIQAKQFIGSLRTSEGACFAERDGSVVLVRGADGAVPKINGVRPTWRIGAPYLQSLQGEFLAIEQRDSGVTVRLAREKTEAAKWVIEVLSSTKPENPKRGSIDERRMLVGLQSSRFRLSVFEGPFKGWYVAADESRDREDTPPAEASVGRKLAVTKDPRRALVFDYVDSKYEIVHK